MCTFLNMIDLMRKTKFFFGTADMEAEFQLKICSMCYNSQFRSVHTEALKLPSLLQHIKTEERITHVDSLIIT